MSWRSANAEFGGGKSLALADLYPVLCRPDLFWVDLQYGDTSVERQDLMQSHGITLWRDPDVDPLASLDLAATQYAALDLVITVSNTSAHLAGSLGVPTWLLLPDPGFGLLWYWQLGRPDSPFYSAVRCFRQGGTGDWTRPVAQVAAALSQSFPRMP